jgi:hypothetical protein
VATDKMNDNSMVSLRRSGRGHIDELRLRKGAQAVDDFILTAGNEAEDDNVPKTQHGNNAKGREVIRCEYGCTAYVWASSGGKRVCPRHV